MFIVRLSYFLIILLLAFTFDSAWAQQSLFQRIRGTNRKEITEFVKQFPEEQYKVYTIPEYGSFYLDDIGDYVKSMLISGHPWEPHIRELIFKYVKPKSIVLDIGAHIGTHTLDMSKQVGPKGRVLAFEPQPKIFRELFWNARLNKAKNIYFYPVAVGDHNGTIELSPLLPYNEAGTSLIWGGAGKFMPLITIDSLMLNNVSLIKIDVELQENLVLDGAKETIARCRPVILIEIRGDYGFENAPPAIKDEIVFTISKLERMGYTVTCIGHADFLAIPI